MKKCYLLIISCMMIVSMSFAQVAITTDGSSPDGSAMLDLKSTSKGLLIPRMTWAQRGAIPSPAIGLIVYVTDMTPGYYFFSSSSTWIHLGGSNLVGSGSSNQVTYWIGNSLYGADSLYWNEFSQRLGIGTKTPGQRLTVHNGNVALTNSGASSYGLQFYEPSPGGANYTAFKAQQQAGDVTYTLPAAAATLSGQTLASTTAGVLSWSSAELPLTFQNGLTRTTNTVNLGGALTDNTTITQDGTETFTIANSGSGNTTVNLAGTGDFQIQDNGSALLTATDDGKIGIGIAAPNQQFEITGSFRLPATTTATTGVIYKGSSSFIHDYKPAGSFAGQNTFVGGVWEFYHVGVNSFLRGELQFSIGIPCFERAYIGVSEYCCGVQFTCSCYHGK